MSQPTLFSQHRRMLLSLAQRLLGDSRAGEDVVQLAYVQWSHASAAELATPKVALAAIVVRLCIDRLAAQPPAAIAEPAPEDALAIGFLTVVHRLDPAARAAVVLHEVFSFDLPEVAAALRLPEAACRQIVDDARREVAMRRPHFTHAMDEVEHVTEQFFVACANRHLEGLLALLTPNVRLETDSGAVPASAAVTPVIEGDLAVARFLIGTRRLASAVRHRLGELDGVPCIFAAHGDKLLAVQRLQISDGRIHAIHVLADPQRLLELGTIHFEH